MDWSNIKVINQEGKMYSRHKKLFWIIGGIIIVILIGLLIYFVANANSNNSNKSTGPTPTPTEETQPFTVAFETPTNGQTVSGSILVKANVSTEETIQKVEFYVDNNLSFTDTVYAYDYTLDTEPLADGSHKLKAVAYDATGKTTQSEITITKSSAPTPTPTAAPTPAPTATPTNTPKPTTSPRPTPTPTPTPPLSASQLPTGFISATFLKPKNGDTVTLIRGKTRVWIKVETNSDVKSVELWVDGVKYSTDDTFPYIISWTPSSSGSHTLKAVATDLNNTNSTSSITVSTK